MQWIANGISNKASELKQRATDFDLDLIMILESHLKPDLSEPSIPGYGKPFCSDRANKDRGGLITYLNDSPEVRNRTPDNRCKLAGSRWVNLTNVYCL